MENFQFDRYKVNQKLYDYAIYGLPKKSTPLEEARYIYNRLCKKLSYSLDYYMEETLSGSPFDPIKRKMSNFAYVETVDGEKNKEVVCYVFVAIYTYILRDRNLISDEDFHENFNISERQFNCFDLNHCPITCSIDGVRLRIDACMGLDMDLCIAKYGYHRLNGWREGWLGNEPEAKARLDALLQREKNQIEEKIAKQNLYKHLKMSKDDYKKLPLSEKVDLFLAAIPDTPTYSFESLSFVAEMYKNIFSSYDPHGNTKYVDSTFVYEKGEVKEYLFVNDKGYKNVEGGENFDALKIYEISLKEKSVKSITREALMRKTVSREGIVISDNPAKRIGSEMLNQATPLSPHYITIPGGKNGK